MGFFGAVFGRSGDVGFSGPLLGASSGVVGFNVATLSRLVHEKVLPAWPDGGCEREKVRPARSQWPKIGVFRRAGRVFSRQSALHPGLVGDVVHFRLAAVGGFCSIRSFASACRRRVGVLMMQFPRGVTPGRFESRAVCCAPSNFARNSPVTLSGFELASLELQRFWLLLKFHVIELRANFGDGPRDAARGNPRSDPGWSRG